MKDSVFTDDDYALAYPEGIEYHFWTRTRIAVLMHVFAAHGLKSKRMLEIGCGKGIVLRELRTRGVDCFGADLANVTATDDIGPFVFLNQDARQLDQAFRDSVEVILLLDVIEHIEFVEPFFIDIQKAFPNASSFIIMVPARKEFWSNYDVHYGHFRRYDLAMTRELGEALKYKVRLNSYFFHSLYLVAYILFRISGKREIRGFSPSKWKRPLHRILATVFFLESVMLPASVPGSSIVTLFKKD